MRRGRLPNCCCRHAPRVDGLERSSGRNASPSAITPTNILSPARSQPGSRTEVSLGARAHTIRSIQHASPTHPHDRRRTSSPNQCLTAGAGTSKQQRGIHATYRRRERRSAWIRAVSASLLPVTDAGASRLRSRAGRTLAARSMRQLAARERRRPAFIGRDCDRLAAALEPMESRPRPRSASAC
jgi:hypothetical protein